jgi:hypothetical protein
MLFFRHVGKTSSIPPPAGGLSAAIVAVARRGKEYHVVAAVEGMNSRLSKRSTVPGWKGCWRLTIWSLTGSCSSTCSRPLPGTPTVGVSTPGWSLDRRVNCRRVPQPRWVGARWSAKGGKSRKETGVKGETRGLRVCPAPRSGALAVGGYKRPRGGSERLTRAPSHPSPRGQPSVRGPWTFLL